MSVSLTSAQYRAQAAAAMTHVWRPSDFMAGRIRDALARPPPALAASDPNRP